MEQTNERLDDDDGYDDDLCKCTVHSACPSTANENTCIYATLVGSYSSDNG
jgi:hypothetical protein